MVINDKQALRRCVKQAVRRAEIVETMLDFDVFKGEMGVKALHEQMIPASGTPIATDYAAAITSMEALELPSGDRVRAELIQNSYTRDAYLREILDVMHAKYVLVRIPTKNVQELPFHDDRLVPLLSISSNEFVPGRYGIDYRQCAEKIDGYVHKCNGQDILLETFDEDVLKYCLFPLCQDKKYRLHIGISNEEELHTLILLADRTLDFQIIVFSDTNLECKLIDAAITRERLLVRLSAVEHLSYAFSKLGFRFIPYASCAKLPEMMLGRWINAREKIWQALCEAYLPLARCGYNLTSENIEKDVQLLMSNLKFKNNEIAQNALE